MDGETHRAGRRRDGGARGGLEPVLRRLARAGRLRDPPGRPSSSHDAFARRACAGAARCAGGAGRGAPLQPPAQRVRPPRRETARRRRHGHGERQVALLLRPHPRRVRPRRVEPRPLPLPHQGARPGPGSPSVEPEASRRGRGHLRRRHAAVAAPGHTRAGHDRPVEPRHAARRDPSRPRSLGRVPAQPAFRRARRGARVPRRLRLARRTGAASPAPAVPSLRRRPALHPDLGDHRQPRTVRREARRTALHGGHRRRLTAARESDRLLEPAAARRRPRPARERAGRGELRRSPRRSCAACASSASPRRASPRSSSTPTPAGASKTATATQPSASRPTAPATRRSSGATSSAVSSTTSSTPSSPPTPSNSASTSAASTSRW